MRLVGALIAAALTAAPAEPPPGLTARLRMPRVFALPKPAESEVNAPNPKPGLRRIGIHRVVPAAAMRSGAWSKLPGGGAVWRVGLRSPGARGMRVHFTQFASGTLWVHAGTAETAGGPYKPLQDDVWSDTVKGDVVVVEYSGARPPAFSIREVSHQFETLARRNSPGDAP